MKMTARGSLTALMTCMAAAVAASPATAGEHVPITVPLQALETPLGMAAPELSTGVPVPVPGAPAAPRHQHGRMLPEDALPRLPVSTELPPTLVAAPVPNLVGKAEEATARLATPPSQLRAEGPGASLGAPLSAPRADNFGLPDLAVPEAALLTPALQGQATGALGLL
ncbi:hypothetical protein NLX86_10055 [Streptomyces sp. A3M-1-3]|uniref:hypothetical protein n=1 Tax=Streptomyces sp. A3M-1-3 TaxID=2962044 RepID=UPI0020B6F455|nr:hypothetical protein [Streptomyces sp. A3M-1-3]MCP3818447.1 hypothetical protein [Streptomyces sp. A3M-1-3]